MDRGLFFFLIFMGFTSISEARPAPSDPMQTIRNRMIRSQVVGRGIHNPKLIRAMKQVPREQFVPKARQEFAYYDTPIPIGFGQTVANPYLVAFLTDSAKIKPTDHVLNVGTGSGYHVAVLGKLAQKVFTIEIVPQLAQSAQKVFQKLGYQNIISKTGDGYAGWKGNAPFDVIILSAAPDHIPRPLIEQLRVGGRLIMPVAKDPMRKTQELVRITRTSKGYRREALKPISLHPIAPVMQGQRATRSQPKLPQS
tara:strand:- start:21 stop:779 length:759 start_codon:yes stop_codon:yes gene_type:complete